MCGNFELRKGFSNKHEVVGQFHVNKDLETTGLVLGANEENKTLGIFWNSYSLGYQSNFLSIGIIEANHHYSKNSTAVPLAGKITWEVDEVLLWCTTII